MQTLAEIIQAAVRRAAALTHNGSDQVPPHIFQRQQAETDILSLHRKARIAGVDVRRQHADAHTLAFSGILDHLSRVVQHARQQGRHEFTWIMPFQISGLVCHHRIGRRMRFIESIGCKAGHIVKNGIGHCFGDPVCHTTGALVPRLGVAVHEMLALLFHDIVLFFAHGAAHKVGLPVRKARQFTADLHHLLLINDASVGNVQNMLQLRRFIFYIARIVPVRNIRWNRLHRARTVQ